MADITRIVQRETDPAAAAALAASGVDPRLARLYAARGVREAAELRTQLDALIAPAGLANIRDAATLLADAIARQEKLLIVADYDADGATACAVGLRALTAMGARVSFIVPNRFEYGYGLTPEIVRLAAEQSPDWIITVDNGIASVDGVAEANRLGMRVLVTDHHLPGDRLPDAACIINPNQPECGFPSKNLAGVGVMFYVMLALRAALRERGAFAGKAEPNLADLLDLVALGTVADVVKLDSNNRVLVHQGLQRIRAGRMQPGVKALFFAAGRDFAKATAYDLGFVAGPRLNAAGRLDDMSLGIECLISNDDATAQRLARELDALNRERRAIEGDMQAEAFARLEDVDAAEVEQRATLCLFEENWHQGVVGILASRVKDKFHRPVIAFARDNEGNLKGSGRSISALHLRDALDLVSKRHPDLILKFGGHAAAAGLTLPPNALPAFKAALEKVAREWLAPADLNRQIEVDGELGDDDLSADFVRRIEAEVWGQGFAAPQWQGHFRVLEQRVVGEKHLKLKVAQQGRTLDAMLFNYADRLPAKIDAVYRPQMNEFRGETTLQLVLNHWA
ncbi:MAG: single-stranded-DNA-specific exonuclease RecJ [Betaproteobacteria bacterium]|nr:single-stranded-DNA-specific exonuclease RecJ [Betaproteobacteria bacterium]